MLEKPLHISENIHLLGWTIHLPTVQHITLYRDDGTFYTTAVSVGNVNIGFLYILAMSSLQVYGVVLAGWSSNNKYSLLGGLRASAQLISYELSMGLALLCVVVLAG